MSFTSSSKQHVRALTQDDSPGTPSTPSATPTNNDETLSFKEVYDLFVAPGDMSPNLSSLFVAATVKREANASTSTSCSPNHNLLLKLNKAIDLISAGHPQEEKQLQQTAAKAYIIPKQKDMSLSSYHKSVITGSIGPRSLNFLDFVVTAAAEGTDKMVCNNFQTLIFGVININTSGVKSFRPLFFVLSPCERKETFEMGVLAC
jgi:hypothetical protein